MSQQRKTMCTYMKNMAGYKMEHFKGKRFYEVRKCLIMFTNRLTPFCAMAVCYGKRKKKQSSSKSLEEKFNKCKRLEKSQNQLRELEITEDMKSSKLVEKDYLLLTKGCWTLNVCNKRQVAQYSLDADELLRKIVILENRPRQ
ncbi:hypothetical protein Tco_1576185 [Tanacetum coccineum]